MWARRARSLIAAVAVAVMTVVPGSLSPQHARAQGAGSLNAPAIDGDSLVWPQFQGTGAHAGVSGFEDPAPGLTRVWTFPMPQDELQLSGAILVGDLAITLGREAVFGIDVSSGELRWTLPRATGEAGLAPLPAVAIVDEVPVLLFLEGRAEGEDSALVAYSLVEEEPEHLWTQPLNDTSVGSVTVDGDMAFVGDVSGNAYGIRIVPEPREDLGPPSSGGVGTPEESPSPSESASEVPPESPSASASEVPTSTAGIGSPSGPSTPAPTGTSPAEQPETPGEQGLIEWFVAAGGVVEAALATGDGVVYVVARDNATGRVGLTALESETGDPVWSQPYSPRVPGGFLSPPTLGEDALYFGTADFLLGAYVHRVDLDSGTSDWSTHLRSVWLPTLPAALDGDALLAVATTGAESAVFRVDAQTGRRSGPFTHGEDAGVWDYEFPTANLQSSPVVVGETVYVGLEDGRLGAIDLPSGVLVWEGEDLGGRLGAIAAGDGVLLVSSEGDDGGLHALRHDPQADLVSTVSPTKLEPGSALRDFGLALVAVTVGFFLLHLAVGALGRRRGEPEAPAAISGNGKGPR